jgi:Phosphatidylinositol N-acetylglucosaminyltransferase subunit Y
MIEDWTYYVYISLTVLPVFFAFRLIQWMGWELFVNN